MTRFMRTLFIFMLGWAAVTVQAQSILVFSPEPGSTVLKNEVLIAASLFDLGGVDPSRVHLFLDDVEISNRAEIDSDMLSYAPALLNPGKHKVRIMVIRDGSEPIEEKWSFDVAGKKRFADQVEWNGKVTSGYRLDQLDNSELSVGTVGLSMRGTIYDKLRFQTNIKMASDEDPLLQPRNRYGFNLSYSRFIDLGFGDVNPRLSRFTVDGKRVRGLDLNLKLGVINFHMIQGELLRSVEGGMAANESYSIKRMAVEDSTTVIELNRTGYTFRQDLLGTRLSFGAGENFQWGFNYMKVKDAINSIDPLLYKARIAFDRDTLGIAAGTYTLEELLALNSTGNYSIGLLDGTDWTGSAPQDNVVLGSDIGFYLDHKKVLLEGEVAFSLYNKDIWDGALSIAELDTMLDDSADGFLNGELDLGIIPIDPRDIEDFFVIGIGMMPLIPIDPSAFSDSSDITLGEAILNMPSMAYRGRAKLQYFGHYFTMEYSRIGPEFRSLGNPYLLTGQKEYSISDRMQFLKNRVMLSLEYRHQDDDVLTSVANVTTQNRLMANITIIPGPGLPTFTIGYRKINRDNGITEIDSIFNSVDSTWTIGDSREETQTDNITATINYTLDVLDARHTLFATYVMFNKADQYSDRNYDPNFIDPGITSNVFNITLNSRFGFLPLKTSLSITSNTSNFSIGPGVAAEQKFTTSKLEAEYGLFNNKLILLGGGNYMKGVGTADISRLGIRAGVKVKLIEDLIANLTVDLRSKTTNGKSTSETLALAGLSYLF